MNNLRCLIYMNPLIVDKVAKSFLYWKDSGFLFTKSLIASLPSDWRYYWLIPQRTYIDLESRPWFKEANEQIDLMPYPYPTGIHQNRYEFYGQTLRETFTYQIDIDVILCNQPEVSANLRTWALNQRRERPLLLSFYHWLDCAESRVGSEELGGYFWRQVDGFLASDYNYFHGTYARYLFQQEWQNRVKDPLDESKLRSFYPTATQFGHDPFPLEVNDKKIVLFNHRLNSTTNWQLALETCRDLNRDDFVLWFTDEQNLKSMGKLAHLPFVRVQAVPPQSYGWLLENAHVALCCHQGYSTWNMAVMDTTSHGCYTLIPEEQPYTSMFGRVGAYHHFDDLAAKLNEALDTNPAQLRGRSEVITQAAPCYLVRTDIQPDIDATIQERLTGTVAKNYEEVKTLITAKGRVKKGEWVNQFWSFHTNSNFQKIRWQLLQDGITDDVGSRETVYRTDGEITHPYRQIMMFEEAVNAKGM